MCDFIGILEKFNCYPLYIVNKFANTPTRASGQLYHFIGIFMSNNPGLRSLYSMKDKERNIFMISRLKDGAVVITSDESESDNPEEISSYDDAVQNFLESHR